MAALQRDQLDSVVVVVEDHGPERLVAVAEEEALQSLVAEQQVAAKLAQTDPFESAVA